ncbi:MAG: DUF3887 domain-containing protein [Eubacteriales bacterium]|nr:DUF3887 domain-containing protein [Eubacteriales bacterium]
MTAEKYVKDIVKGIQCDKKRGKDIQKQLLSEVKERLAAGEKLEDIMEDMGSVKEIAASFNETPTIAINKSRSNKKLFMAILSIVGVLAGMILIALLILPKQSDIAKSDVFDVDEVNAAVVQTIDWLDEGDYDALQKNAREDMANILTADIMDPVKDKLREDWGKRISLGKIYAMEITQKKNHFATCQVSASYENVNVIYTISFDENMHVAGLYLK